jgi:hypothetical protein
MDKINDIEGKESQAKLKRQAQTENDENTEIIKKLNKQCYALTQNIKFYEKKNEEIENEIKKRESELDIIEKKLSQIKVNKEGDDAQNLIKEHKKKKINEILEKILSDKVPELNIQNDGDKNENIDNEFRNLVFDHVVLYNTQLDVQSSTNEKSRKLFRISAQSTFEDLHQVSCQYWSIENKEDWVITDDAEAIIYNEKEKINDWLKAYSPLINNFKLVSINTLKERKMLVGNQDNRIKEMNKLGVKGEKGESYSQQSQNNPREEINNFFNEFPGLKPFILLDDKSKEFTDKSAEDASVQAKNVETSFWMLLILILFFFLNLFFIYDQRDISRNNLKINYIKNLFDNKSVINYVSLYNYIIQKFAFNFWGILAPPGGLMDIDDPKLNNWLNKSVNALKQGGSSTDDYIQFVEENNKKKLNITKFYNYLESTRNSTIDFNLVSSIHMIMSRVKTVDCSTNPIVSQNILSKSDICYSINLSRNTEDTEFGVNKIDPTYFRDPQLKTKFIQNTTFKDSATANIHFDVSHD